MSNDKINNEEKHIVRQREEAEERLKAAAAQQPGPGQPNAEAVKAAREAIRCEINITLFKDGNFQMQGPFEDRILFEGVMAMAQDLMRQQWLLAAQRNAPRVQPVGVDPRIMSKLKGGR